MLCQQCQRRNVNVHIVHEANGSKLERFLCNECAKDIHKLNFTFTEGKCNLNVNFNGLLTGFIGNNAVLKDAKQNACCNICKMSFEDFQKTGKLGCGTCYETFINELAPIIARIHGNVENKGKIPFKIFSKGKEEQELEVLRKELKIAISDEEYEEAAKLRDLIRQIESKNIS